VILASLLMKWEIDRGMERTRYPHTIEFAITKNLFDMDVHVHDCYVMENFGNMHTRNI
jgi:hypothetical protein